MNFCPKCESILYLDLNKETESEKTQLFEKCLNCGHNQQSKSLCKDGNKSKICVYSNSISNDSLDNTKSILDNKYVIKDMTLPRLGNITCINPECLTRKYDNDTLIIVNNDNINLDKLEKKISSLIGKEVKFQKISLEKKKLLDYNEIHLNNNVFFDFGNIKNNSILIKPNFSINSVIDIFTEEKIQLNINLKNCLVNYEGADVYISPINTQVVFIKYDTINMKYMYICSTCSTSWKNIT